MTNRLKELRQKNNLTLKELSEQLSERNVKISADALAKYERGDREPKIDKWNNLAEFYGVSTSYLMGIDSHKPKNRLRKLRNKAGLSQNKLVSSFNNYLAKNNVKGITVATYSRWENSNNSPTKEMWKHLADYFDVSVPYIRGEIDTELIAKIAKETLLISCNRSEFKTKREFFPNDEDARTIAITELMLLLFEELGLDHTREFNELVTKNANLLKLKGKKKEDYIKGASVSATDENYNTDIQNAKALIDLYNKL